MFFGQWVDPDLGNYGDDYVGCVPSEGIGIVYNGDANDELYGANPPMLCVDFFKGPRKQNGVDKDGNPTYEILNMSAFVYYNNDWSVIGNPEIAPVGRIPGRGHTRGVRTGHVHFVQTELDVR